MTATIEMSISVDEIDGGDRSIKVNTHDQQSGATYCFAQFVIPYGLRNGPSWGSNKQNYHDDAALAVELAMNGLAMYLLSLVKLH